MGSSNSVEKKNKERDEKVYNIELTGNRLAITYTDRYLDPDFCNQVTMINNDDLVRFHHQKVNGKSYSFGYIGDVPQIKQTICEGIQEEYRLKKELVTKILNCFKDCNARMDSITRGPICSGNPEILREELCRPPNTWMEVVGVPEKKVKQNKQWFETLEDIHGHFMKQLTILENILIDLDKHDDAFSIDKIKNMIQIVDKIEKGLQGECSRFQKHMLTIPTFTNEEEKVQIKIREENQKLSEAKKAALLNGTDIKI